MKIAFLMNSDRQFLQGAQKIEKKISTASRTKVKHAMSEFTERF